MLTLTYEYKLKPTKQQINIIENILSVCCKVWNFALKERKEWVNSRKCNVNACSIKSEYIIKADEPFPSYHNQSKKLTEAKKINPELKAVNAQALQQVLRNLERAWDNMKARNFGFPRFKKPNRVKSFVFPQLSKDILQGNRLKLPQLGWTKFFNSREIPPGFVIKQAKVVKRASGYFVLLIIQMDVNVPDPPYSGYSIGIDIGLENFLATSEGELIARPKFFNLLHCKLKLLQRRLKKKTIGSSNWNKLNQKIAKVYETIANTRKDFHFKLANHLCGQADAIFVEDINFIAWAKGILGKHTLDAGFGQFFTILKHVAWKRGVYFAKVDKNYTSQICPNCGTHTGKKNLSDRIHKCFECGYTTNRDVAAAQVIRNRGIDAVGQTVY